MLPLVLTVPLALVGLDLVAPWPSALGVGVLPVLAPSGWTSEAARSRRLSPSYTCEELNMPEGEECEGVKKMKDFLEAFGWTGDADDIRAFSTNHTCEGLNMPEREECEKLKRYFMTFGLVLIALAVLQVASCVAQLIFMCQYKSSVTNRRPPLQPGAGAAQLNESGNFATGLCNCFDDCPTCLHACFCMACRAGDTYQSAGIIKYWHVIALFWVVVMVWHGWYGLKMVWHEELAWIHYNPSVLVMGCIFYRFRRTLRVKLGKNKADQPNIFIDILLYALCTCCVVAQEARAYDAATGVKVECCCELTDRAGQPLYGQAQPLVGQPVQEDQGGSPSSSSSSSGE